MRNKTGHRPTRAQKEIIEKSGHNWELWNVIDQDNLSLTIVNKTTKERKVLLC